MAEFSWSTVQLPSKGVFYSGSLPDGMVQIRKHTANEEAILQSNGMDVIDRMSLVLKNCLRLPDNFSYEIPGTGLKFSGPDGLLTSDRFALIIHQRLLTFGAKVVFPFRCPKCNVSTKQTLDMGKDLEVIDPERLAREAEERGLPSVFSEPYEVVLEDAGMKVSMRLLRGCDESEIYRKSKQIRIQTQTPADPSYCASFSRQIISIDKVPEWNNWNLERKSAWVGPLSATDTARMRIATERRETGLDSTAVVCCRACGCESQVTLQDQMTADFFRPSDL